MFYCYYYYYILLLLLLLLLLSISLLLLILLLLNVALSIQLQVGSLPDLRNTGKENKRTWRATLSNCTSPEFLRLNNEKERTVKE